MHLLVGSEAPDFETQDHLGNRLALHEYRGSSVLLAFNRFAGCPTCNLRIAELMEYAPRRPELQILAVFNSTNEAMRAGVGNLQPPFPLISDPDKRLYRLYGVQLSLWGAIRGAVAGAGRYYTAVFRRRFMPRIDGNILIMPADFFIDSKGIIRAIYYGKDSTAHMPISDIEVLLQ